MSALGLDPTMQLVLRGSLALLFAWAAAHKLRDAAAFRSALASYRLLPGNWTVPVAVLLSAFEVAVSAMLCIPILARAGALGAAALLLTYAAAIATNLLRGRRDIDCGCSGVVSHQALSGWLVARNVVLVLAALAASLHTAPRKLNWLDTFTITAGIAVVALLYAAIDGLIASAPLPSRRVDRADPFETVPYG